jgi:AcrR family transcriptional regulator
MANDSGLATRRDAASAESRPEYLQKRAELLSAAARIFRAKGYRAASVAEIARAAKVDRASLYYYTSGKRELFNAVVYGAVRENVEFAESVVHSTADPAAKLRRIIIGLMRSYNAHYPHLFVYVQEDMARLADKRDPHDREMRNLGKRYEKAIVNVIEDGLSRGSFHSSAPPSVVALAILGMVNWTHRWYRPSGPVSAEDIGEAFASLTLDGLTRESHD